MPNRHQHIRLTLDFYHFVDTVILIELCSSKISTRVLMLPNDQHQDFVETFLDSQRHSKCQVVHIKYIKHPRSSRYGWSTTSEDGSNCKPFSIGVFDPL